MLWYPTQAKIRLEWDTTALDQWITQDIQPWAFQAAENSPNEGHGFSRKKPQLRGL
jgi:hypothetical protein